MEACRTTGLVSLFLLLFWLLIPGHIHGQQTSEQEKYHVDSTLFVYYQHCKTEIKSPSVMQMLDTLFLMAKEKGDLRMQAVAISSKTDHFYFGPSFEGQEDSLILYTNAIKDFARKTNQPQYYYFAWANRLITYYTKQKKLNLALYEANKMQQESESREEIDGMQNCYQALLRIYQSKELYKQATVYAQKLIDLTLKYNLNKYNLTNKYLELSNCYLRTNEPKKAWDALGEGLSGPGPQDHPAVEHDLHPAAAPAGVQKRVDEVALGVGAVEPDGLLGSSEDDGLGAVLDQIAQGRRRVGHGIGAVADDEAVVLVVMLPDGPGQAQPMVRPDVGAVQTVQLQAVHPAQLSHPGCVLQKAAGVQLGSQTVCRLTGGNGAAGADHEDVFHSKAPLTNQWYCPWRPGRSAPPARSPSAAGGLHRRIPGAAAPETDPAGCRRRSGPTGPGAGACRPAAPAGKIPPTGPAPGEPASKAPPSRR